MPYTGLTAKLTIGDADVAYISNWSVDETCDTLEITKLGENTKEILPSLCYWSASAEGTADFSGSSQSAIRQAMIDGTSVKVRFYLDTNAKGNSPETKFTYLEGTAYVNSFSVNISAEDKGGVSIGLTGEGKLNLVTNTTTPNTANI